MIEKLRTPVLVSTRSSKRELNKARRRLEIVQIAAICFLRDGYSATSMSAIADRLGGSKTTLWSHFASKDALFGAVVEHEVAKFVESFGYIVQSRPFSLQFVRDSASHFLSCLVQRRSVQLFRLLLTEGERFPDIAHRFYEAGPNAIRQRMRLVLERGLDDRSAEDITEVMFSAIIGYRSDLLMRPCKPASTDHGAFLDRLMAMVAWRIAAGQASLPA